MRISVLQSLVKSIESIPMRFLRIVLPSTLRTDAGSLAHQQLYHFDIAFVT